MNFWKRSERFPPIVCRILARTKNGPPLSNDDLAEKTGLTVYQIVALSQQFDWSGVDLPTTRRFVQACGTDFEDYATRQRMVVYLRGRTVKGHRIPPPFSYLREHPDFESFFKPLMARLFKYGHRQT